MMYLLGHLFLVDIFAIVFFFFLFKWKMCVIVVAIVIVLLFFSRALRSMSQSLFKRANVNNKFMQNIIYFINDAWTWAIHHFFLFFFCVRWKKRWFEKIQQAIRAKTNITESNGLHIAFLLLWLFGFFAVVCCWFFISVCIYFRFCVNAIIIFIDRSQVNQMLKETASLNKHKKFIYDWIVSPFCILHLFHVFFV